ncbi:MAG: hypothetical protein J7M21_01860 [Planctomycetes bacterium]|nr:hypothetical protein [Planctomycetota bacterium]
MCPQEETPSARQHAIELAVLALLAVAFMAVSLFVQKPFTGPPQQRLQSVGIIIAAGLTLIMYSMLYRDNPLFKIAENLYVGVTLGYGAIITWRQSLRPEVYEPLLAAPTLDAFKLALLHRAVPVLMGLLLLTRISRKHGWLSRYAYALMVGWGAGISISIVTHTYILQQLEAAVAPLRSAAGGAVPPTFSAAWFNQVALPIAGALIVLVGTVAVLFYFFFSIEHGPAGRTVSRIGIWFLMISFGASFGYTVMGRLSLLIGRVRFLLMEWLKISR